MPRRALALIAVCLVAVALIITSLRGGGAGEVAVAEQPVPRPQKPIMTPSGAVAIEAPAIDGGLQVMALPAVAAMAAAADGGVRPVPIDLATGNPLAPARVLEGSAAGDTIPVPRRVRDRGVITR